jgi:hypothetical protein
MQSWRRDLKTADYPLDVRTDLSGVSFDGNGIMWP